MTYDDTADAYEETVEELLSGDDDAIDRFYEFTAEIGAFFDGVDDMERFARALQNEDYEEAVDATAYTEEELVEFMEYVEAVKDDLADAVDEDAINAFAEEYGLSCPYMPEE